MAPPQINRRRIGYSLAGLLLLSAYVSLMTPELGFLSSESAFIVYQAGRIFGFSIWVMHGLTLLCIFTSFFHISFCKTIRKYKMALALFSDCHNSIYFQL